MPVTDTDNRAQTPNRMTWSTNDTGHHELDVLAMLETGLDQLNPATRRRVIAWMNDRFSEGP